MGRRRVKKPPIAIFLPTWTLQHEYALFQMLALSRGRTRHQVRELYAMFALKQDERLFARELLYHKPHYWIFRGNQRRFCGDFVVVDMSCPVLRKRKVYVIDLKQNTPLKWGGGGAGIQFKNAARAVHMISEMTGAIPRNARYEKLVGDHRRLLTFFGVDEWVFPVPPERESVEATVGRA